MYRSRCLILLFLLLAFLAVPGRMVARTIPLDALLRGARIHYQEGRYDRALETFQQAFDQYSEQAEPSTRADMHIWLGLSQAQLRNLDVAAGHFRTAISLDENTVNRLSDDEQWAHWSWVSLFGRAREFYALNKPDSSLAYAMAAASIDPDRPGPFSVIASSYSALERYDDMLATAREMLDAEPASPEAYSLIGLYYLKRPDEMWAGEMKTARWDSCAYYYGRAIELHEQRYNDAIESLSETLGIPKGPRLDEIARKLIDKSRSPDHQILQDYIEKDLDAARMLSEVAQYASSLVFAASNLNVTSSRAGSALLSAATETTDDTADRFRTQAENLFAKALKYEPNDYASLFNLGIANYQAQNDSSAEANFRKVIEMTVVPLTTLPRDVPSNLLAAITRDAAEDGYLQLDGEPAAMVDEALDELGNPITGFTWLYFPELSERREFTTPGLEDAEDMYLSVQNPSFLEYIYLLTGQTQASIGFALEKEAKGSGRAKLEQAISSMKMVIKLDPDNPEAWQNLVGFYRETGQQEKAFEAAQRYEKLTGGR